MAQQSGLSAATVTGLIAAQFTALAGLPVTPMGGGCDHELFALGDQWVLRFPRTAERVPWLEREREILSIVGETIKRGIPRFELAGQPSPAFPYPFVGYRRLAGVSADRCRVRELPRLAADLGALLTELHRVEPGRIPMTPAGWERETWRTFRLDLLDAADSVRRLLPPDLRGPAEPYLAGVMPEPPDDGPRRLIHNDISPDHVIVNPDNGRLNGLIDFTDAMVGDPVLDMAGLIGIDGYRFIHAVKAGYGLALGGGFEPKLRWVTRTLTLTWLAEAARHDPDQVPKHLAWVARALE